MPGDFSKANRPIRPGTYVHFEADTEAAVPPAIGSIVAIPFTADWGPFKQVTALNSLAEYRAIFGDSTQTDGYRAVQQAFRGEGTPGVGGAGVVLAYRMGGATAAKATRILLNSAASPVPGITLSSKYEGSRGNNLRVTTETNAYDPLKKDLVILDGTVEVERFTHTPIALAPLAADINLTSDFVVAVLGTDGVALAPVTGVALTGGSDGATVTTGEWTSAMSALELERFSLFAAYNLVDPTIHASLKSWVQTQNNAGKRFMALIGGSSSDTISTAVTRSATMNDPNIINLGVGYVTDSGLLDTAGLPIQLDTSKLTARVAGILAQRGEAMSLTFARLTGCTLFSGPGDSAVRSAFEGGVTVLSRDSNLVSPVRIEKGLTTFIDKADPDRPYLIYRTPKYVRTMDGLQNELQEWADSNVIGRLPVNNKTRDYVLGQTRSLLTARDGAGVIQPGWTAEVDPTPPPSDDDEFVAILIGLRFGRSVEQVYFTIKVG